MIFVDTCILIDYSRRNFDVVSFVESIGKENIYINSIVEMELLQGALNNKDLFQIKKDLQGFSLLPINQNILRDATQLLATFRLSHQAKIPDMIIAATARYFNIELKTYNTKDFRFIPNLKLSDSF